MARRHTDAFDIGAVAQGIDRAEGGRRGTAGHAVPALLESDGDAKQAQQEETSRQGPSGPPERGGNRAASERKI